MRVCGSCGINARERPTRCKICSADPASRTTAPALEGLVIAGVRTETICPRCSEPRIFSHFSLVEPCERCGYDHTIEIDRWDEPVSWAHEVTDLAGARVAEHPVPGELATSSHASLGIGATTEFKGREQTTLVDPKDRSDGELTFTSSASVSIETGPGHPPCFSCARPFELRAAAPGRVEVSCACGASAVYETPPTVIARWPQLAGVVAEEYRVGLAEGRVDRGVDGVVVLHCPTCGAAVQTQVSSASLPCPFCKTWLRLPHALRPRVGPEARRSQLWWWVFRGPCAPRSRIEQEHAADVAFAAQIGPAPRALTPALRAYSDYMWWAPAVAGFTIGGAFGGLSGCISQTCAEDGCGGEHEFTGPDVLRAFEGAILLATAGVLAGWLRGLWRRHAARYVLRNGTVSARPPLQLTHPRYPRSSIGLASLRHCPGVDSTRSFVFILLVICLLGTASVFLGEWLARR